MVPTKLVLWSCLAGAFAVLADKNITVDDFDSRIVYTGPWMHENVTAPLSCPPSTDLCEATEWRDVGPIQPYHELYFPSSSVCISQVQWHGYLLHRIWGPAARKRYLPGDIGWTERGA